MTQTIELFNYTDGVWEEVDSQNASRFTDATVTVEATGDVSRFVETGTDCILARVRYQSGNARQKFSANMDQISWTVE